jgi:hypothetical protein
MAVDLDHDGYAETFEYGGVTTLNLPLNIKRKAHDVDVDPDQASESPQKKMKRSHVHRKDQRNKKVVKEGHKATGKALHGVVEEATQLTVEIEIKLEELPASSCGYRAKSQGSSKPGIHTVEYYKSLGYRVLKNDGS